MTANQDNIAFIATPSNLLALCGIWIAYHLAHVLYNISPWHPLRRFPGPKLAAASPLYEFWYDMILGGTYTDRIKVIHRVYGMSIA